MFYEDVLRFAKKAHKGVKRKFSGEDYVEHPIRTSEYVSIFLGTKKHDLVLAGLLHDVIEDTKYTFEDISSRFGEKIARLVLEVTSDDSLVEKMGKGNYLFCKMLSMTDEALLLKLCDRLDNFKDWRKASPKFAIKYCKETEYIITNIVSERDLNNNCEKACDIIFQHVLDCKSYFNLGERK